MTLPSSGALTLDQMHVEAGGTTQTQAGMNDSDIRGLISKGSGTQMAFNEWYGASSGPPTDIAVGDYFAFTSCKMMGMHGPYEEMLQPYYSDQGYNSTFTDLFQTMQYAGVQRWKFPTAGTYKFRLAGAWAGHNVDRGYDLSNGSNYYDTTAVTYSDGYSGWYANNNYYSGGSDSYGLPGILTVERVVAENDILDIMIGQRSFPMYYGSGNGTANVCAPGGGATAIAFNNGTTSGWDYAAANYNAGEVAIAGGAGANRNTNQYAYSNRNSQYGINGSAGDYNGAGGTNGYGGSDGTSGYYDFTSGAGWRGDGSEHTDERTTSNGNYPYDNIQVLDGRAKAIFTGNYKGQGGMSAPVWAKPYYYNSYQRGTLYLLIDNNHLVSGFGEKQNGTSSFSVTQPKMETWANATSVNKKTFSQLQSLGITSSYGGGQAVSVFPVGCFMGGFGGGSVGSYGGAGAGGGWSGGGAGRYYYGGAGSSYKVGFTASTHLHQNIALNVGNYAFFGDPASWKFKGANCPYFGINSYTWIESGLVRGNGWLIVERTA